MSLFLLIAFFGFLCFVGGFLACCWLDATDVIAPDFCDVAAFMPTQSRSFEETLKKVDERMHFLPVRHTDVVRILERDRTFSKWLRDIDAA